MSQSFVSSVASVACAVLLCACTSLTGDESARDEDGGQLLDAGANSLDGASSTDGASEDGATPCQGADCVDAAGTCGEDEPDCDDDGTCDALDDDSHCGGCDIACDTHASC